MYTETHSIMWFEPSVFKSLAGRAVSGSMTLTLLA